MRGTILVSVCLGLLIGCGQETKTPTGESAEPAAPVPTAGTPSAAVGKPAAASGKAAECQAACEHRKSCNVPGEVAACVDDCTLTYDLTGKEGLAAYGKASCDEVKKGENDFQTAVLCRRACRHRAECLPGTDGAACEAECAGLMLMTDQPAGSILSPYIAAACDVVKSEEAGFQQGAGCLRACGKMMECGVRNDLKQCVGVCAQEVEAGKVTAAQAHELSKKSCDQVRAQFKPQSTPAARAPAAGGLSGNGCRNNGAQDCPHFSKCCRNSDFTQPGSGPGNCISPAICLMPTR